MAVITPPKVNVPIGTVRVANVSYEVTTHPEFVRFFETLFRRVGGTAGSSSEDLTLSQFEDAGIAEQEHKLYAIERELRMDPTAVQAVQDQYLDGQSSALLEEISALRRRIEALEQGLTP